MYNYTQLHTHLHHRYNLSRLCSFGLAAFALLLDRKIMQRREHGHCQKTAAMLRCRLTCTHCFYVWPPC